MFQWVNACVDMVRLVGDTWGGQTYGKIDSLSISANCKLRRILTMKHQLHDSTDDHGTQCVFNCHQYLLLCSLDYKTLTMQIYRYALV